MDKGRCEEQKRERAERKGGWHDRKMSVHVHTGKNTAVEAEDKCCPTAKSIEGHRSRAGARGVREGQCMALKRT
jgi:hypothetical protein